MTPQAMVRALVAHRMQRGVNKTTARLKLAMDLGTSERAVRYWEVVGMTPRPMAVRAIQQLYDREVGNG